MKCSWKKQDVTTYAKNDFQLNFRHNSCITSKILTKVLFMMSQYYDLRHLMTHITDRYNMGHMIHYLFVIIDNARFIFDSYMNFHDIFEVFRSKVFCTLSHSHVVGTIRFAIQFHIGLSMCRRSAMQCKIVI